jgi:hypothetical protein
MPVVALGVFPIQTVSAAQFILPGAFAALLVFTVWVSMVVGTRVVCINPSSGSVEVTWRTATLRKRRATFALGQFKAVVSYNQPGRYARTRVELNSLAGDHSLLLATYPAGSVAKSFWSVPRDVESGEARSTRISVARACGLRDDGFVGLRIPGAQLL